MARWCNRSLLVASCLCLLGTISARAQLNWRYFNRGSDGLEAGWPTYLSFSPKGNLWIRYRDDPMITELDGYEAHSIIGPEISEAAPVGFRVYESESGQLWSLYPEGVEWLEGETWRYKMVPEIRKEIRQQPTRAVRPIPLLPAEINHLFILLSDRLIKFSIRDPLKLIKESAAVGLDRFSDLLPAADGGFWITAENGIARVKVPKHGLDLVTPDTPWEVFRIPDDIDAIRLQHPFEDGDGGLLMMAEERTGAARIWVHFQKGGRWSIEPSPHGFKAAWMTSDGKAWGLETTGLSQWSPPDLKTRDMDGIDLRPWGSSDVVREPGGAFWVSAPNGVWRYSPYSWRPPGGAPDLNEAIMDIHETADGTLWFLGAEHLLRLRKEHWTEFTLPPAPARSAAAPLTLGEFTDGRLFFTENGKVVTFDPADEQFGQLTAPGGASVRYLGTSSNALWFASNNHAAARQELELFDGKSWSGPTVSQPGDEIGEWSAFIETGSGSFWLGGAKGAAHYANGDWTYFNAAKRPYPAGVTALLDRGEGNIWAATREGLMAFNGQFWSDLQPGIGRVNRMTTTKGGKDGRAGTVYLATEGEVMRQYESQWISMGAEEGAPTGILVVRQSRDGRLWLGHERGLSVFHPEVDRDPPETYFDTPRKDTYSGSETIVFSYSGRDRWKATSPDRLFYSYRIDEGPWLFTGKKRVSLPASALPAGAHTFEVSALDRMLNRDPIPESWQFTVVLTWYKDYRVLGILILAAIVVLVFASLAVNRHLTLVRSYAAIERIVAERTRQLEQANRELAHAEKMRSLGTLAAGVAHDFNSILSIIRGSIQIIESNPGNEDKIRTRISRIKGMVEQGSTLVKAMLGFSRADDTRLAVENVGELVADTERLLSDRLPPEVDVVVDVTPGLPPVHGTRELLQQILVNLVLNALDAMERRGQLALRCHRAHSLPDNWVIAPAPASEYVGVSVEDTGSGITPENLSRIFEPFFTTKSFSTRHGTGLGLSMVYEFCKELGYGINVRSETKNGTCFTIYVPVFERTGGRSPEKKAGG